jgi:leucyl/phenylalanyl-tRNA--protein transferase
MIFRLSTELIFPDPSLSEADGLLAVGGDLKPDRLLLAYQNGIFPWPSEGQPLLWYSPHERFVLFPDKLKVSSSMTKVIREKQFEITINKAFSDVIDACSSTKRSGQKGTWITKKMKTAYCELHKRGHAISVEAWQNGELAGGLYGVVCGKVFCGESMFSKTTNASKAAFIQFVRNGSWTLIDCQVHTMHLESLGAEMIPQKMYLNLLNAGA